MYHTYLGLCNSRSICLQLKMITFFNCDLNILRRLRIPSDTEIRREWVNLLQSDAYSEATSFSLLQSDGNIVAQNGARR